METAGAGMAVNEQQERARAALPPPAFPTPPPGAQQVDAIVQEAMQYLQERGLDPFEGGSEGVVQQAFGMVAANAIAAAATAMSCKLLSTLAPTTPSSRRRQTPADEQPAAAGEEQQAAKRQRPDGALPLCPHKTNIKTPPESAVPVGINEAVTAGAQRGAAMLEEIQKTFTNTVTAALLIDLTTEDEEVQAAAAEDDALMQAPGEDAAGCRTDAAAAVNKENEGGDVRGSASDDEEELFPDPGTNKSPLDPPPRGATTMRETDYINQQVAKHPKKKEQARQAWVGRNDVAQVGNKKMAFNLPLRRDVVKKTIQLPAVLGPMLSLCQAKAKALGCSGAASDKVFLGWLIDWFAKHHSLYELDLDEEELEGVLAGDADKFMALAKRLKEPAADAAPPAAAVAPDAA